MGTTDSTLPPWDLYREIHKGLRLALFTTATVAGSTDPADDAALGALRREWRDTLFVLRGHHHHEDDFVDPLIDKYASHLRSNIDQDHAAIEQSLTELDAAANALTDPTADERGVRLQRFYLDLSRFTSVYLDHMVYEEEVVMPELNEVLSDEQLADVTAAIRGSVPPPDMCIFMRYMVPGMNPDERAGMFAAMYANAPADVFEQFRRAAEAALTPADYRALAERAGFA
jgi:Hemerythrin HHE cation binding domain